MLESIANFSNKYPFTARILYYLLIIIHFLSGIYMATIVFFINTTFHLSLFVFLCFIVSLSWSLFNGCIFTDIENALDNNKKNNTEHKYNILIEPFIYFFSEKNVYMGFAYIVTIWLTVITLIALYKINNLCK
jgi:hypothetical protein